MPPQDRDEELRRKLDIGAVSDRAGSLEAWQDYLASRETDNEPLFARGDFALPRPQDQQPLPLLPEGAQTNNTESMRRYGVDLHAYTYPSGGHDAMRLRDASTSNEQYNATKRLLDAEEVRFLEWYAQRAAQEGLVQDPYDPLHMFDYKAYWRQLQNEEEMMKGMDPENIADLKRKLSKRLGPNGELPSEFDWRTEEGEAELIKKAKEAFGKDWSYDNPSETSVGMRTGKHPKYMDISDIRDLQRQIKEFYANKPKPSHTKDLIEWVDNDDGYSRSPKYPFDPGITDVRDQSEANYRKLVSGKWHTDKKGNMVRKPAPTFKKIGKQPPDPHPKSIMPEADTGKAPPEVTEELRGMDPSVMEQLRENPQLRSIFGLE